VVVLVDGSTSAAAGAFTGFRNGGVASDGELSLSAKAPDGEGTVLLVEESDTSWEGSPPAEVEVEVDEEGSSSI
jgi:hypothetical protein